MPKRKLSADNSNSASTMSVDYLDIDGSVLEGGGQILRIALTLSAIKKIPVRISKIRSGRSKPGLMEQHFKGATLVRQICKGESHNVSLGSTEIELIPSSLPGGHYQSIITTAGSICLLLQSALPCSLFAESKTVLKLIGGTNAEMAPQIDYMIHVFKPILERFGATADIKIIRRGYFPKGGGEIHVEINPVDSLKPIQLLDPGTITAVRGWSFVAGTLPISLAHTMATSATDILKQDIKVDINIQRYKEERDVAHHNCAGIILVAETSTGCILGGSALHRNREKVEETGSRAAKELLKPIKEGACVDQHAQDQIIVFMALAKGHSSVRIGELTLHTKTAIYIAEKMTQAKFEVVKESSGNIIQCTGSK